MNEEVEKKEERRESRREKGGMVMICIFVSDVKEPCCLHQLTS